MIKLGTFIQDTLNAFMSIWAKLTDSGWNDLVNTSTFRIRYRKKNGIVYVECDHALGGKNLVANTWVTIGTLPEGYRPSIGHTFVYNCKGGMPGQNAKIYPGGTIQLYCVSASNYYAFSTQFPIDD